jgi:hypothetical protein
MYLLILFKCTKVVKMIIYKAPLLRTVSVRLCMIPINV